MIRLPYLSTVLFSGPDALDFLHAQLSSDIRALQEGDATFACYCTPRGQVLGLLLVGKYQSQEVQIGQILVLMMVEEILSDLMVLVT